LLAEHLPDVQALGLNHTCDVLAACNFKLSIPKLRWACLGCEGERQELLLLVALYVWVLSLGTETVTLSVPD
jgi:hypothetical protein